MMWLAAVSYFDILRSFRSPITMQYNFTVNSVLDSTFCQAVPLIPVLRARLLPVADPVGGSGDPLLLVALFIGKPSPGFTKIQFSEPEISKFVWGRPSKIPI